MAMMKNKDKKINRKNIVLMVEAGIRMPKVNNRVKSGNNTTKSNKANKVISQVRMWNCSKTTS